MVMQIEVRHDDSFHSVRRGDENDVNVVLTETSRRDSSMRSLSRDTSNTCRDVSMDNTRQTVNTHNSILDFSKEEEDDDDDEDGHDDGSVMFGDLQQSVPADDELSTKSSGFGRFSFHTVTDTFVDSLCPGPVCANTSAACNVTPNCTRPPVCEVNSSLSQQRVQVGFDVWSLLGCANYPGAMELKSIWRVQPLKRKPRVPTRANIKDRIQRIHKLRMERWSGASRHGYTRSTSSILRSQTFDPLEDVIGQGIEPILKEDGYDSDPEFRSAAHHSPPSNPIPSVVPDESFAGVDEQDYEIYQTVQQTLNSTWTLTWHPNPQNTKEFGISKPMCINIWMERGTVVTHNGVVVEPMFMWRDAYQPHLSQRRLNPSTQKPWSMRLLNFCRITECTQLNRKLYPLASKASHCMILRTCYQQEFLLEASSPSQMKMICERWKLVIARFASLAVTEDIDAIAQEFFHPTLTSQTLTLPPNHTFSS